MTTNIKLEKGHYTVDLNRTEMSRRFADKAFGKEVEVSGTLFDYKLKPHLAEWLEERETTYKLQRAYDFVKDEMGMAIVIDDIAVAVEFKLTWL
jgi:hypothetical protein